MNSSEKKDIIYLITLIDDKNIEEEDEARINSIILKYKLEDYDDF